MDAVPYNGRYYWHQQPFPSIILLPFKFFWKSFDQSTMQTFLVILLCLLLYKITRLYIKTISHSILLVIVFMFGSPILGLILNPSSWYYAQLITVVLMVGLILEMETKKRPILMGTLLAFILATRPTAGLIIIPILYLLNKRRTSETAKNLLIFIVPVLFTILGLLFFNYIRFNDIFYNAYVSSNAGGVMPYLRSFGLLSIEHIPTNLYNYFLISVSPVTDRSGAHLVFPYITYSTWGISLFLMAPFFLYSLKSFFIKEKIIQFYWLVIFLNLSFLMLFFAPGWVQFGPRYTADFLPILYLLILKGLHSNKLTTKQELLIILSSLFNIYLYTTPFFIPH